MCTIQYFRVLVRKVVEDGYRVLVDLLPLVDLLRLDGLVHLDDRHHQGVLLHQDDQVYHQDGLAYLLV